MTTQTNPQTWTAFYILGKPLTLVDFINRRAAATGSIHYAMAAANADYNGHALNLSWNDYRGYYVLEYYYGERVVLHRGADFAAALAAAKAELKQQGRGATLSIVPRESDLDLARADSELTEGNVYQLPFPRNDAPDSWKWPLVADAMRTRTESYLINAATLEQYQSAVTAARRG